MQHLTIRIVRIHLDSLQETCAASGCPLTAFSAERGAELPSQRRGYGGLIEMVFDFFPRSI
jgi:hypothetical protein